MSDPSNNSAQPLYQKIAGKLQTAIARGDYAVGSLLPTEKDLCQDFDISRYTARAALKELQERGIISRRQGSGSTVQAVEPSIKYNQFVESIEDLLEYGNSTSFKIISSEHVNTGDYLSTMLNCPLDSDCMVLKGLRFENNSDKPFCTSEIYRLSNKDHLEPLYDNKEKAIFAIIDELQLDHIGRVEQNITAVNLSPEQAQQLDLSIGTAALKIVRRYFKTDRELLMIAVSTHPGPYFTYTNTFVNGGQ